MTTEPARRIEPRSPWIWLAPALAIAAGLAIRIFFIVKFRNPTVDGDLYELLARNWRDHGIYGFDLNGRLAPVDIRMPGYPAFLLAVSSLLGRGWWPKMLAQVFLDLGTCLFAGAIAGWLVPPAYTGRSRRRVRLAAIWLAALCPFIANYTASLLTEVLAAFFTAAALFALAAACTGAEALPRPFVPRALNSPDTPQKFSLLRNTWFLGGLAVGFGTLVRPETPLLLAALAVLLIWRWRRPADWSKLLRAGALTAVGLLLPLIPWVVRNAVSLHEFRMLAPRYANLPGESVPRGFYTWANTWLVHYRDADTIVWKVDEDPLDISVFPSEAFDTPEERRRVAALIDQYNEDCCDVTAAWDAQFSQLAAERAARHPLRTYLTVPFRRALTIWFTPRNEVLPYSSDLLPLRDNFRENRHDFLVTLLLGAIGVLYVGLALAGAARIFLLRRILPSPQLWAAGLLVTFCVLRTAFFTRVEVPEPRYVLECFPALFAFAAMLWLRPESQNSAR